MTRTIRLTLSLLCFITARAFAQPEIAYIIPDVGAPGMNTYVEIVAPINAIGTFDPAAGQNTGLVSPNAATVEFVNPEDSNRVVVSPFVVSWEGRLISCQFFVNPGAAIGPVPFRVRINNDLSNVDTFYIQRPQTFGVKNGGGVIGSGGAWGNRSRRGAMVVDSMILNAGSYSIELSDTDPSTPGEQGYLPFIVLSKGPIRIGSGAFINAGASGKHGGPGGGGGGGFGGGTTTPIPIQIQSENDVPLGNGFSGGRSSVTGVNPRTSNFGKGTGSNSASLNGTRAATGYQPNFPTIRGYAAAPGHPFDSDGRSGGASALVLGPNLSFGQYFGGGGNATKGQSSFPASEDYLNGQIVGNRHIVPIHGGAGGAGGGPTDSVGAGGGGGLAIYSQQAAQVSDARANGADGADGCANCSPVSGKASGGGAGGCIMIGGKLGLRLNNVSVAGGAAGATQEPARSNGSTSGSGGAGRFRHDGRIISGNVTMTPNATHYTGPTTDTLTFASQPIFTLRGTAQYIENQQNKIQVYVRGEDTPWNIAAPYNAFVNADSTWQVEIAVTTRDSTLYIFAVHETAIRNTDEWTRDPSLVFSQAAANIVGYRPAPILAAPREFVIDTVVCASSIFDTIYYRNTGAGALTVDGISYSGASEIALVSPTSFPRTIEPGNVDTVILRFDGTSRQGKTVNGTVTIDSDDPGAGKDPWTIDISAMILGRDYISLNPNSGTIDFGNVPVNSSVNRTASVTHSMSFPEDVVVDSLWTSPPTIGITILSRTIPANDPISAGETLTVEVRFRPTASQTLTDVYLCARLREPCLDTICWLLTGKGVQAALSTSKGALSMIVPPCTSPREAFDTVLISNTGTDSFDLLSLTAVPAGTFTVMEPTVPPNRSVGPGENVRVIVRYRSDGSGPASESGTLQIRSTDVAVGDLDLTITGTDQRSGIELDPAKLDMVSLCNADVFDTVTIRNSGSVEQTVTLNPLSAPFEFVPATTTITLGPGEEREVAVRFSPPGAGPYSASISGSVQPCDISFSIPVSGTVTAASLQFLQNPVDLNSIPVGTSTQRVAQVRNTGSTNVRIVSARIVPPNAELTVTQSFPVDIAPSTEGNILIRFAPTTQSPIPAGTYLEITLENGCVDSVPIIGNGGATSLTAVPSPVDFNLVPECKTVVDTVWLYNRTTLSVTILEVVVLPAPDDFTAELVDQTNPTPLLQPGDSAAVVVTFDPGAPPDGVKTATLRVRTNSSTGPTVDVPLRGERISESLTLDGPGFGATYAGGSSTARHFLINNGTAPIAINDLTTRPPFTIVNTDPQIPPPHLLAPGDTLFVDIEFAPVRAGTFEDSIDITGITYCGPISVDLVASSEPTTIASARWKDISGEPGERVLIPLEVESDLTGTNTTQYRVDARFNKRMLFPHGVEFAGTISAGWVVTETAFDTGSVMITAEGKKGLAGSGTLLYLDATVLLGDQLTTPVSSSDTTAFLRGGATIQVEPGTFSLEGYCAVGSNRLIRITDEFGIKYAAPNPVRDNIVVEFELIEDGPTRLTLFDALGREVAVLLDADMPADPHRIEHRLDLPAGTYVLELRTRTQRDIVTTVVGD